MNYFAIFQRNIIAKLPTIRNPPLQNHQMNKQGTKHTRGKGIYYIQSMGNAFSQGAIQPYNSRNTLTRFKFRLFQITRQMLTKNKGTKHPWVKEILVCSHVPRFFPTGYNTTILKIHGQQLQIFFSEPVGQFSPIYAQVIFGLKVLMFV